VQSMSAMLNENRADLRGALRDLHQTARQLKSTLPPAVSQARNALARLPRAIESGQSFFEEGRQTFRDADALLIGNRENIYRMIFAFRKAAENLAALSDDLRRNPWKLMNKQKEKPPAPHARERELEEFMLSTGRMGLVPPKH